LGRCSAETHVSEHRFFVPPEAIVGSQVSFSTQQVHQLKDVLRLRPGERVRVFDGVEPVDLLVDPSGRVVDRCAQPPEPRTKVIAYPALLQRDKFESVLQKLTEIGVWEVVPVIARRSLARAVPDGPRMERWQSIVREAAEQCGRGHVPVLRTALPFVAAVQKAVAEGIAILAYEGEQRRTLREALDVATTTVAIFVGPEGGYEPSEAELAEKVGARLVTMGPRILRTETASPVLAALVLYERGDLSSWLEP
jgi:16S rRNA (uracil1498-N3)-methyltransferase